MIEPVRKTSSVYSTGGIADDSGTSYCKFLCRMAVEKLEGGSSGLTKGGWEVSVVDELGISSDFSSSNGTDGILKVSAMLNQIGNECDEYFKILCLPLFSLVKV